jgi:hypothetical protein
MISGERIVEVHRLIFLPMLAGEGVGWKSVLHLVRVVVALPALGRVVVGKTTASGLGHRRGFTQKLLKLGTQWMGGFCASFCGHSYPPCFQQTRP